MKSLYLRIWLTVVVALALFASVTGWVVERHIKEERAQAEAQLLERLSSWGDLIQNSLPEAEAPADVQAKAIQDWSRRLRLPLALDNNIGQRVAASDSYLRREHTADEGSTATSFKMSDGRVLWMMRPVFGRGFNDEFGRGGPGGPGGPNGRPGPDAGPGRGPVDRGGPMDRPPGASGRPEELQRFDRMDRPPRTLMGPMMFPREWPAGLGLAALLVLLFLAVAGGAYPVVRGITRRLEKLKQGVERFGSGVLEHRVDATGRDEVAAVAASFNRAADRIAALIQSNQALLANASHELRSPLARLKMAVAMLDDAPPALVTKLQLEINTNIAELDALVEEVLLSSRLQADAPMELSEPVDLLGLLAEEASRVGATAQGEALTVQGSDRLLRRAVRNLLENARRYAGEGIEASVSTGAAGEVLVRICDQGPGVPVDERERIFEPFYRMPGHAEREGGVGLGLALVRQIAERHGGQVRCEERPGGGSCFVISLPTTRPAAAAPSA
ncbi:sensor histidine kinase [Ideonella margarita]|uniref:histidine kinase n=1 Tax=Ideonella margarita TaxID=2984191 RepID=A0ABU9C0B2_9BURK